MLEVRISYYIVILRVSIWVSMMSLSLTALCPTALAVEARGLLQGGNYTYHSLCLSQEGAQMFICAVSPLRASCAGTLEGGAR